jgi:cellular nucleic acid-binding protein
MSRECPKEKIFRCRNCDDEGHSARECPKPKDWSRVKCNNCQEFGHTVARCNNPTVEPDNGGWGNGGGKSGAAAGGWGSGGGDAAAATGDWANGGEGEVSTGNWADETTAAANGANGDSWGDSGSAAVGW